LKMILLNILRRVVPLLELLQCCISKQSGISLKRKWLMENG
jgi:hypothetical protein